MSYSRLVRKESSSENQADAQLIKQKSSSADEVDENTVFTELFNMFIDFVRNRMLANHGLLSDEIIEALSRLSLTCKSMYNLLLINNQKSPFYYLPTSFLLNKTSIILMGKWAVYRGTEWRTTYLSEHISELEALEKKPFLERMLYARNEFKKPPRNSSYWKHSKIAGNVEHATIYIPLLILFLLAIIAKLPGTEELAHLINKAKYSSNDSSDDSNIENKTMGIVFASIIMFLAEGALASLLAIMINEFLQLALRAFWLKNAKNELASLTIYEKEKLDDYQTKHDFLKSQDLANPGSKHLALSLFNRVNTLKPVPAVAIAVADVEAQEEPKLRMAP